MKKISIQDYINSLKMELPPKNEFLKLSKITPVNPKYSERGIVNFERGILLYALISKLKPKTILEIGTAEGYSTLCMAWAMSNNNIDGKIFTIDPKPHNQPVERSLILNDKESINQSYSTKQLWEEFAKPEWLEKIEVITGYAGEVLYKTKFPKIQFSYIDGAHFYEAVKHDFYGFLKSADKEFSVLFDDYIPGRNDGVTKFVDEEIVKNFETIFIKTDAKKHRQEVGIDLSGDEQIMCFIESNSLKDDIWKIFPKNKIEEYIKSYLILEKRIKLRKKLDKKIPYLKNIKFQWWKK